MTRIVEKKNKIAYRIGGHGVDVGLTQAPQFYPCSTQEDRVYWGDKKYNTPSYVIADTRDSLKGLDGYERDQYWYHSSTDTYVQLISVNGIGEIRWGVSPLMVRAGDEDAAIHFGLIDY